MLIKRITFYIYLLLILIGILLLIYTDFNYSIDIILATSIPVSILLPDLILYKYNTKKAIFTNCISLLNECHLAISTVDFFKKELSNISSDIFNRHFNSIELMYNNLLANDSYIYFFKRNKFLCMIKEINTKYLNLKVSNSTLKYCISTYNLDKSNNCIENEKKYLDELDRQLDIMSSIYNSIIDILNKYSDIIFSSKAKNDWDYQQESLKSALLQEDMRSKI